MRRAGVEPADPVGLGESNPAPLIRFLKPLSRHQPKPSRLRAPWDVNMAEAGTLGTIGFTQP